MTSSRHRRNTKRLTIGFVALAAVFAGLLFLTRTDSGGDEIAAPDITLEYFNGDIQQLTDLAGRPVVLNFWASWCPACVAEMPAFGEVHRRLGDDVEFIGVNMQEVDMDAAMDLVDQTGVEYRLVHDPNGSIYRQFGGFSGERGHARSFDCLGHEGQHPDRARWTHWPLDR